jgi:hypothetical protein
MKKCSVMIILALALTATMAFAAGGREAAPVEAAKPVELVFSTHGVGTGMYMTAAALAPIIEAGLPPGSRVNVETTGGGISGPMLVGTGKVDISLGNNNTVRWLYDGTLEGQPKVDGFRAIAGGLDNPTSTIIFTEDFIRRTGYKSIGDIVANKYPVRIAIKVVGTLGEQITHMVFEAYGATLADVKSWGGQIYNVGTSDIVGMLKDNRADITLDHVSEGQAATSELALTTKVQFINLSKDAQDKLVAKGFARRIMKSGTWANQNYDVVTVAAPVVILVHKDMSDNTAYVITKAVIENKEALAKANAALEPFDTATAWAPDKVQAPLHPGAERYYREKGLLK